jgi:hypothetical protein
MAFKNYIIIFPANQLTLTNILCDQSGEFFKVKPDGRNAYHKPRG